MADIRKVDSKSESDSLLLVEGLNDCHAIFQLNWLAHGCDPVFGIHECGSDDKVLDSLASRVVSSRPRQTILGVVLDADLDGVGADQVIKSRFDQIAARVGSFYPLPDTFPQNGLIVEPLQNRPDAHRLPRLGAWLMPNNKACGMFEDLLMQSLPAEVPKYTRTVLTKAKADGFASFKDIHMSKPAIRTYLAWQDPPDVQYLGLAIKKGLFQNIEAECKAFVEWLDSLFKVVVPGS